MFKLIVTDILILDVVRVQWFKLLKKGIKHILADTLYSI